MTLTPNFLPVGSIVEYNGAPCIVIEILRNNCIATVGNSGHISEFNGIPLTPEILTEWCNAKKWGRDDMPRTISYDFGFIQIFPANSFCDFEGYGFMHYKPNENELTESARVVIHYLHELQLLFLGFKTVLPITIK